MEPIDEVVESIRTPQFSSGMLVSLNDSYGDKSVRKNFCHTAVILNFYYDLSYYSMVDYELTPIIGTKFRPEPSSWIKIRPLDFTVVQHISSRAKSQTNKISEDLIVEAKSLLLAEILRPYQYQHGDHVLSTKDGNEYTIVRIVGKFNSPSYLKGAKRQYRPDELGVWFSLAPRNSTAQTGNSSRTVSQHTLETEYELC